MALLAMLFIIMFLGAAAGACLVVGWGAHLLDRDDARARSMRAAADINQMVIQARSMLIDSALKANRSNRDEHS